MISKNLDEENSDGEKFLIQDFKTDGIISESTECGL
tara:strand:- start:187 stop:294 length:108 start_codon:yes stop_codon:yes gene_type:complete